MMRTGSEVLLRTKLQRSSGAFPSIHPVFKMHDMGIAHLDQLPGGGMTHGPCFAVDDKPRRVVLWKFIFMALDLIVGD